jgi:quercetin dioxygenase-like cupin family protein
VWRDFVHATDELVMPVEGRIELEFGGRVYRPQIGEEVFIPAGAVHTVRNVGGTTARWLYGYRRA